MGMGYKSVLIGTVVFLLVGCSSSEKITLKPQDIPTLYSTPLEKNNTEQTSVAANEINSAANPEPISPGANIEPAAVVASSQAARSTATALNNDSENNEITAQKQNPNCENIHSEITMIDAGLGQKAQDTPPKTKPTAMQRVGNYFKDMAVETIKGPFQPIIQSVRAATNAEEKDRSQAEATSRGKVRRAYLMGYGQGLGCATETGEPDLETLESDG